MNKELEEFIKSYNKIKQCKEIVANIDRDFFFKLVDELLQALEKLQGDNIILKVAKEEAEELLENSIPKEELEDKIKDLESNKEYLSKFKDWNEKEYTNEDLINACLEILKELLKGK